MSRLAIDPRFLSWWRPGAVRLDIGRSRLTLQDGEKQTRHKLAIADPLGIPDQRTTRGAAQRNRGLVCSAASGTAHAGNHRERCARPLLDTRTSAGPGFAQGNPGAGGRSDATALRRQRRQRGAMGAAPRSSHHSPATGRPSRCPTALLELLQDIAGEHGWRIGKIQTRFVSSINARLGAWRKPAKHAVYSLETSDGLTIGIRSAGVWLALRTHPPLRLLGTDLAGHAAPRLPGGRHMPSRTAAFMPCAGRSGEAPREDRLRPAKPAQVVHAPETQRRHAGAVARHGVEHHRRNRSRLSAKRIHRCRPRKKCTPSTVRSTN